MTTPTPITRPVSRAQYLSSQLSRYKFFYDSDAPRSEDIRRAILQYVLDEGPKGSGFDAGTSLDPDKSHDQKLVFNTYFHHMDENGSYDGWTEHSVVVTPTFRDFDMRVTGRNRNHIKDHIAETFTHWLNEPVEEFAKVEDA